MSRTETVTCDRCCKVTEGSFWTIETNQGDFDLCFACNLDFDKWLRNPPTKETVEPPNDSADSGGGRG